MGELIDRIRGRFKRWLGGVRHDRSQRAEGWVEEKKGEVKGKVEDLKHDIRNP